MQSHNKQLERDTALRGRRKRVISLCVRAALVSAARPLNCGAMP